jgi:hypothetical protein
VFTWFVYGSVARWIQPLSGFRVHLEICTCIFCIFHDLKNMPTPLPSDLAISSLRCWRCCRLVAYAGRRKTGPLTGQDANMNQSPINHVSNSPKYQNLSRDQVLNACLWTSAAMGSVGLIAMVGGPAVTAFGFTSTARDSLGQLGTFWDLIAAIVLGLLVTVTRFGLMLTWPALKASTDAANSQVSLTPSTSFNIFCTSSINFANT